MASFPYDFQANFETGDDSEFTSTIGTQVSVKDYKYLARNRAWGMPFRGAYALFAELGVDTDSYVRSTSIAIGSGGNEHSRFMFYIGDDVEATTTTEVILYTMEPAVAAVGVRIESGGDIKFGIRSNTDAFTTSDIVLEKGKWYTAELHSATTNGNTCTARLKELGIELETVNDVVTGAITEGRLGVIGVGAGSLADVSGSIILDQLVHDVSRVYGVDERFPQRLLINDSQQHVFVGSGCIEDIQLLAGAGTDCVLEVYDTDEADTTMSNLVARVTNNTSGETVNYEGRLPIRVSKGAYITLSGTDPQAVISIGIAGAYGTEAVLRNLAQ